jgi:hypothetical protein
MSDATITIDEQDLPTVLAMLREKGIAVAQVEEGRTVGGRVGEAHTSTRGGRDVGGSVGHVEG